VHKGRLEAFSDGVIAIIITIMVLELKIPQGPELAALRPLVPVLLSYLFSFIFIGIYWNNHHHLMQAAHKINGRILWANLHLLFWLSIIPFVTGWMGENCYSPWPVAFYGGLLAAGTAYYILARALVSLHGQHSAIAIALGGDFKGKISVVIYALAIPLAFLHVALAYALYLVVAVMWLVPDRRIENTLSQEPTA
jgi:uncharacterized membrane protein